MEVDEEEKRRETATYLVVFSMYISKNHLALDEITVELHIILCRVDSIPLFATTICFVFILEVLRGLEKYLQ